MLRGIFTSLAQIDISETELKIPQSVPNDDSVTAVLSLFFAVVGSLAFLIIVLSGLRFTLSRGNPEAANKARNGIIYAAIGMVIALLAFAIVRFVARSL